MKTRHAQLKSQETPSSESFNHWFFKYCMYLPATLLRGERWRSHLEDLEKSQWLNASELSTIQTQKLAKLIASAVGEVPYYKRLISSTSAANFAKSAGVLDQLPFITKQALVFNQQDLTNQNAGIRVTRKTTGGSTGQAVTILKNRDATAREIAGQWRGFHWAGLDLGYRQGRFWGVQPSGKARWTAKLADFIANRRRCSAFSFSVAEMEQYVKTMQKFEPDYLYGYVSMLVTFAEYLEDAGQMLGPKLKSVITTAEVLTETQKMRMESVYGVRVFNEYGCGEIGTIAHECDAGSMHVNAENMIIEIMDGDRACALGEIGEIVVTELNNTAMPLIRYRLGDYGSLSASECTCGRGLPVLENIAGRAYDLVRNEQGKLFHGEFFMYMFEDAKRRNLGIEQFQVVQRSRSDFEIRIVANDRYGSAAKELITTRIRDGFGSHTKVSFVRVDEIKRANSGKMRLIIGLESPENIDARSPD